MTLTYPKLTITGDVDGDGADETGVFEMESADVEPGIQTGSLFQRSGGLIQSARAVVTDSRREEIFIDGGVGATRITVQFTGWEGSDGQWGDDASAGLSETSATGQSPIQQVSVLLKYLIEVNIGSGNPATLEWGEFSDGGLYDPFKVAVEEPTLPRSREEASTFTGNITFISVADLDRLGDSINRTD